MMKNKFIVLTLILIPYLFSGCDSDSVTRVMTNGREIVTFRALPFSIADVKLLNGPFHRATELDSALLLSYQPDRFLSKFYSEAGLAPKAPNYEGWENETLAGHSLGHYLSACSMMYLTTGDSAFLKRVNYIINELEIVQSANKNGYLGAFQNGKRILEDEVGKGDIRSQGFDLNGIWAPFYTQHKIMAGLRDAYRLCGNEKALEVEKRFATWLDGIITPLTDEQIQKMLRCEHGGISETLADLYADTGDKNYLRLSGIFYQKSFLDPLKEGNDILPGKHCNTNIPKLISLARLYELTGDTSDRKAAEFFWKTVTENHSYVTGGNGNNEYFGPAGKLRNRLGDGTTESCNVYNMLKLTEHLFQWEATTSSADFYERALFNHILSSQNPENGRVTYNLSLDMGGFKDFQDPEWFTCCIGSGMENHSKYGKNIYYHSDNELFLFQYIASELSWKEKGLIITQTTLFPEEHGTTLQFTCKEPVKLTLQIRYPYWASGGIEIFVNGKKMRYDCQPGSFVPVMRNWRNGDLVEIRFPFSLRLETMPDDSNRVAFMYGPLVMAGDLGPVKDSAYKDPLYVPVFMTSERDPSLWLKPVDGKANTFVTTGTGRPRDVQLIPFYKIYNRRYSVYWDLFDEAGWKAREAEYLAEAERMKKIRESTIDFVQPGEMQPERDHRFRGEKTSPGTFRERPNRESRSGWFSYEMKCDPGIPAALAVEYWGGFPGAKTFDILVNDKVIATENIKEKKEGQFIVIQYEIPMNLTAGKKKIIVKFLAHQGNMAGPVFGLRTISLQNKNK